MSATSMVVRFRNVVAFLAGLIVMSPLLAAAEDILLVTAMHGERRPIRTITSQRALATFRELWSAREKQGAEIAMRRDYKIAVRLEERSESWFYDPDGFAQALSKAKTPVYRLASPAAVNKLLGIEATKSR
jgi:hypothetical protein